MCYGSFSITGVLKILLWNFISGVDFFFVVLIELSPSHTFCGQCIMFKAELSFVYFATIQNLIADQKELPILIFFHDNTAQPNWLSCE